MTGIVLYKSYCVNNMFLLFKTFGELNTDLGFSNETVNPLYKNIFS